MASSPPSQGQELYDDASSGQNPHLGPRRPALTPEEIAILKECNQESFWYRCVPFSIAFMGGATYLTSAGILKGNPRYGSLFKNMGACLLGYIMGKLSYQGQCRQKILERAPNSTLARAMRGEKVNTPESNIEFYPEPSRSEPSFRKTDLGESRPTFKDLDDTQRPSLDREIRITDIKPQDESGQDSSGLSYEELRRRHRAEYEAKMATSPQHPLRQPPFPPRGSPAPPPQESEPYPGLSRPPPSGAPSRKNQYGDTIE